MMSPPLRDVSLYELALSSEHPPHPLQISPTTFKSMVATIIDLLIDQKIAATLWLKLPKGDVWQAELERFRRSATAPYTLCILNSVKDEGGDRPGLAESRSEPAVVSHLVDETIDDAASDVLVDDQGVIANEVVDQCKTYLVPLASETQLRREYFMLVLAPEFSGLMLAHRPRSIRAARADAPAETPAPLLPDDESERKHPLLAVCSLDAPTLQKVLTGVRRAIAFSQPSFELGPDLQELLANWETLTAPAAHLALEPTLLGGLLARQIQRQEDLWHSTAGYRRQAETAASLQMENEELQNAIRLKDEFLKNVGQELRTPLATMKTALSLLNSPSLKPPQRQRYMDMLTHECDRQSSLITSVLDLIQLENLDDRITIQPLRLIDVVPGIVSTYQPLAQEKGVMLAYTVPEDLPAVSCTAPWLRQIVINLLHNGIKFTPKGGQVWVRAKQQGDYVQIEVRDTGIGIAPADIPKIFDRFFRIRHTGTDDSGGAGLGLSIVQQLLLRCGGSISVKSKPGEGSTFTVLLPIYQK